MDLSTKTGYNPHRLTYRQSYLARGWPLMEAMTPTTAMLAFDRLEQQLKIAKGRGFKIRKEWLGGATGGFCRFNQQDWIFVDLSLSVAEQLEQVTQAIALATVGDR